jgi:hypothetical protein
MNDGMPDRITISPFTAPSSILTSRASSRAKNGGTPSFIERAKTNPTTAKVDPTERSNSPAIINMATPTTIIPRILEKERILERATGVRKLSAVMEKKNKIAPKLTSVTASGNLDSLKRN